MAARNARQVLGLSPRASRMRRTPSTDAACPPAPLVGPSRLRTGWNHRPWRWLGLWGLVLATSASGEVIYVDANSDSQQPDGTSWCMAYRDLQVALAQAEPGDDIWVAGSSRGTVYQPAGAGGDRITSFELESGVRILGGFFADLNSEECRGDPADQNPDAFVSVLTGDLLGDDDARGGGRGDNSFHVVRVAGDVDASAVLDGFVIRGGQADDPDDFTGRLGGGIFNLGSPTLTRCSFEDCFATLGGGMYNDAVEDGGGSPWIERCTFEDNTASLRGGGVYSAVGSPVFYLCRFETNQARNAGGGMFISGIADAPVLIATTWRSNTAGQGGSSGTGGGLSDAGPATQLVNCVFWDNAAHKGGAIETRTGSTLLVVNTTLGGNRADSGGGIFAPQQVRLRNCIVAANFGQTAPQIDGFADVRYSLVEGGRPGEGNVDGDPMFVGVDVGRLRVLRGSVAIDAADNTAVPADAFDLDGDGDTTEPIPFDVTFGGLDDAGNLIRFARFVDDPFTTDTGNGIAPYVDMGAYEFGDCNANGIDDLDEIADDPDIDCNGNHVPDECDIADGTSQDCHAPFEDGFGTPDECDIANGITPDCNENGIPDPCDIRQGNSSDCNRNRIPDDCEDDCDADGIPDDCEIRDCDGDPECADCNDDGIPDGCQLDGNDCNNDLIPDDCQLEDNDCNADGVPDDCQLDDNDCNADNIPDDCQLEDNDCNADGVPDDCQLDGNDCNADNIPDDCQLDGNDCNGDGVPDECQLDDNDCNTDGIPDDCQLAGNDCNVNGTPDECEEDCNDNGRPDDCDIDRGSSDDCDENGIPDECDMASCPDDDPTCQDCNDNGVPDGCDIADGTSQDCHAPFEQGFGTPDECDIANGITPDCNGNGIPDPCDIRQGNSSDCNLNRNPDECDIADGTSEDCNFDGVPDDCQLDDNDCNANGTLDVCDIDSGVSADCNADRVPDECQLDDNDCNGNGIPDECEVRCGIEVVFLVDTSDSFADEMPDVCQMASRLRLVLGNAGVSVETSFVGTTTNPPADSICVPRGARFSRTNVIDAPGWGTAEVPGDGSCGPLDSNESWAAAAAIVAQHYPWLDSQTGEPQRARIIVPVSDEGPCRGEPCEDPGPDRDTILNAITVARQNGVTVFPITGDGADECTVSLADLLAAETGGTAYHRDDATDYRAIGDLLRAALTDQAEAECNDCNGNGIPDDCEPDCDGDGTPDDCEIRDCTGQPECADCNADGVPDGCQLDGNDCNNDLIPDDCQLTDNDCNADDIPDDCQLDGNDCNNDGVPDDCQLTDNDCNADGIPDECQLDGNDCNTDGIPDDCQLTDNDCNTDGIPDECQLDGNDCNTDGIPDDCQLTDNDCDGDGLPDDCEADDNGNGVPDDCECDLLNRLSVDCQPDTGGFVVTASVRSDLPAGTELTFDLDDGADQRSATVDDRGRAEVSFVVQFGGRHTVCIVDCPDFPCKSTRCDGK